MKCLKNISSQILLIFGFMLALAEMKGVSFAELLSKVFNSEMSKEVADYCLWIFFAAATIQIVSSVINFFDSTVEDVEPSIPAFYACMSRNNYEIGSHLTDLERFKVGDDKTLLFDNTHDFQNNMQVVSVQLVEQINRAFRGKIDDFSESDVFVSVFTQKESELPLKSSVTLHYCCHIDPSYDTSTKLLSTMGKTRDFAGTSVIKNGNVNYCYNINNENYIKSGSERRATVEHFIGAPLKLKYHQGEDGVVAGILNIEFHKKCFNTRQDLKNFYRKNIQTFVYLYEYQLYKRSFFSNV